MQTTTHLIEAEAEAEDSDAEGINVDNEINSDAIYPSDFAREELGDY